MVWNTRPLSSLKWENLENTWCVKYLSSPLWRDGLLIGKKGCHFLFLNQLCFTSTRYLDRCLIPCRNKTMDPKVNIVISDSWSFGVWKYSPLCWICADSKLALPISNPRSYIGIICTALKSNFSLDLDTCVTFRISSCWKQIRRLI